MIEIKMELRLTKSAHFLGATTPLDDYSAGYSRMKLLGFSPQS